MPQNTAPIALIRKLAAEGAPAEVPEGYEKQLGKDYQRTHQKHVQRTALPTTLGALGGAIGGGILSERLTRTKLPALDFMGQTLLPESHIAGDPFIGALGGGVMGGALGHAAAHLSPETRKLRDKMQSIQTERDALGARTPGSTTVLTDENLDRDRYGELRADAAQARLNLREAGKPTRVGAGLGALAGAGAGLLSGYRASGGRASEMAAHGLLGTSLGIGAGAIGGSLASGRSFPLAIRRQIQTEEARQRFRRGAQTLDAEKEAAARANFDSLFVGPDPTLEETIDELKFAAIADPELLKVAYVLAEDDLLTTYEALGGIYKVAFGQQMFDTKQLAGSPALAGGMNQRASTATPTLAQPGAQAPQSPAAPKVPTSQPSQGSSAPSAASATSAPSTPGATTITVG
jgi:hypothetical protein